MTASTPGPVAVVTIAHGRHRHLRRQVRSIDALPASTPVHHVVVAMGDGEIADVVAQEQSGSRPAAIARRTVTEVAVGPDGELPLAAARTFGAQVALESGAELLVFLDVDCLAHRDLVTDYRAAVAARSVPTDGRASAAGRDPDELAGPVLWCGRVSYLPPLPDGVADYPLVGLESWAEPHPARPVLPAGTTQLSRDVRLFWSLNFAVTASDWDVTGGFHPGYRGYGGEDTDFAQVVATRGGGLGWIGGADAFHQHHPTSSPPWQHLPAIVRNAHLFRERWGWFPMQGWLEAFAAAGAIDYRPDDGILAVDPPPAPTL